VLQRNVTIAAYYVAIGLLLMMLLAALQWFAGKEFEL